MVSFLVVSAERESGAKKATLEMPGAIGMPDAIEMLFLIERPAMQERLERPFFPLAMPHAIMAVSTKRSFAFIGSTMGSKR